jgi:hypothetical protein
VGEWESEYNVKPEYVEPVLYPSGTDFLTRMPTERRSDWMAWGREGNRVSEVEGGEEML